MVKTTKAKKSDDDKVNQMIRDQMGMESKDCDPVIV